VAITNAVEPHNHAGQAIRDIPKIIDSLTMCVKSWIACSMRGHLDEFQADYAKEMITDVPVFAGFQSAHVIAIIEG